MSTRCQWRSSNLFSLVIQGDTRTFEQENLRFSVIVVDDSKLAPPPKIFAGACARPETGMDFGLAFMTLRPQTVNLPCKHNVARAALPALPFSLSSAPASLFFLSLVFTNRSLCGGESQSGEILIVFQEQIC